MRPSLALAALALTLPLAACTNTRTAADASEKGATSRAAQFDATAYTGAVAETPGTRGGGAGGTLSGTLAAGDLQLDDGSYADVYGVNLNAGDRLTVDLNSTAFDPYLAILTPDGQGHENDDWEGDRTHSRIAVTASQSGAYAIITTSFVPGATGNYTVTVEAPSEVVVVPAEALQ